MREAERHGNVNVLDLVTGSPARHGSEYHTACPWCGGDDRFVIWPEKEHGGRFWCRQCGRMGDCIDLLKAQGYSFKQAMELVGVQIESADRKLIESLPGVLSKAQERARREVETLSDKDLTRRVEMRYMTHLEGASSEIVLRALRRAYEYRDNEAFEHAHRLLTRRLLVALKIAARFDELYPAQVNSFLRSAMHTTTEAEFERLGMDRKTEGTVWDS